MLRIMSKKKTVWLRNKTRKTEFDIIIEKDGRSKHIFVVEIIHNTETFQDLPFLNNFTDFEEDTEICVSLDGKETSLLFVEQQNLEVTILILIGFLI